jgi:tetratricopeptide (TPR) repeat protein
MMRRITPTALVMILAVACAHAQDYRVQYLEGLVEVQKGATWREIAAGESVPRASIVRLDEGAFAELTSAGSTLRLTRRGTYDLSQLAAADMQARSAGVGTFLSQRAQALAPARETATRHQAGVAGVRGDDKDEKQKVTWVGSESAKDLLTAGMRELAGGDYTEARALFEDAEKAAVGPDIARATFYKGYAAYLDGKVTEALRALEAPRPDPATAHYEDHVLVLAQVLVETFAYTDAAELLQGYLRGGKTTADNAQTARLLLGLSQKGLGNRQQAVDTLRVAQQANPASPAGRAAARLLETL